MKSFYYLIVCMLLAGSLCAQNEITKKRKLDSLAEKLRNDSLRTYRFKKLRPYGNIDNRNAFIRNPASIGGFQLGVIVNEYHTFGGGIYRLNPTTEKDALIRNGYRMNGLRYVTIFYEYFLLNKRFVEIDLPFELGIGRYDASLADTTRDTRQRNLAGAFIPLGSAVKLILKPVRWIGVSFMGGYRYALEKQRNLNLNGVYYSVGVWIDFRQVYRDIKYYGYQKKKYRQAVHRLQAS
jgi:hypothetical protein